MKPPRERFFGALDLIAYFLNSSSREDMQLKDRILRALYGSSLITLGLGVTACGEDTESNNDTPGWQLNNTNSTSNNGTSNNTTPNNTTSNNTTANTTTMPDPCYPNGVAPTRLTPENWQNELGSATTDDRFLVCGDSNGMACPTAESFDYFTGSQFVQAAVNFQDTGCAPLSPQYINKSACGPTQSTSDLCCYVMAVSPSSCVEGRPFTIEGAASLAKTRQRDGWCEGDAVTGLVTLPEALREEVVEAWLRAATHEHASVASFARFAMELLSLGAPLKLVSQATQAMHDELSHARHCFSIAAHHAGVALGPDVLPIAGALERSLDERHVLEGAILEGCVGETLSAAQMEWLAQRANPSELQRILKEIAEEEGRHAELSWAFVRWMLEARPHLRSFAEEVFASAREQFTSQTEWAAGATEAEHVLWGHGVMREATEAHLQRRSFAQIVSPCWEALQQVLTRGEEATHV